MSAGDVAGVRGGKRAALRWTLALLAAAAAMLLLRARLEEAHVALVFLLVVLGGSADGGRVLGVALAVAAFVLFNFLFVPPFHTLVVADPLDWLVLLAFLVTGIVAAQLLDRAQREAAVARRRAAEVDRLAALGAETLSAGRADDALAAIARVIRTTLGVAECDVFLRDATGALASTHARRADGASRPFLDPESLLAWVAANGRTVAELADGAIRMAPESGAATLTPDGALEREVRALSVPLVVRDRVVGVLRIADSSPFVLDQERRRFLDALAYYAALGAERVRLSAEAEHAEALREADRLKDGLMASVSHDLRTPLTTIGALAHDIAREGDPRAAVIEAEVRRLNRFVTDLLDLSRLTARAVPLSLSLNAAEDLLGAALERVRGAAGEREIRAALDREAPMLVGRFDFTHALRILVNLLENALKFAPADTPVDLAVRRDGDALAFTVADRGPGVAHGEEERVFARFYRPPGTPPDASGSGLGLAIARGLAEAQGGTLTYAPRAGGGSTFTLRLPAADDADPGHEAGETLVDS